VDIIKAFAFGVAIATAVGPIAILVITNGLVYGFRAAMASAIGAALADLTFSLVAFTAGSRLATLLEDHRTVFTIASSAVLIAFGLWMIHGARQLRRSVDEDVEPTKRGRRIGLFGTYALTITNPLTILGFLGFSGQLRYSGEWAPVFYLSFAVFAGSLSIQTVFAAFSHGLRTVIKSPTAVRNLNYLGGALVIGFGIVGLVSAIPG